MGDKATLRMARQELEDLYLVGVPDDSVDLTFKDLASTTCSSLPAAAKSNSNLPAPPPPPPAHAAAVDQRNNKTGLARSSTNIFTYRPLEDREDDMDSTTTLGGHGGGLLQLPPSPPHHENSAVADGRMIHNKHNSNYKQRPGIPHSNICALCNKYVYLFRHRCLVCGRVYCRRCVGTGMGDMTEGRKCIDCLGRRYSHRYIHRAGDTTGCLCFWGYNYNPSANAVTAQELLWAEKGPAPRRRRPRHNPAAGSSSISTSSYCNSTNTIASASINSDNSIAGNSIASASSSSFVASYAPNPHAFPL